MVRNLTAEQMAVITEALDALALMVVNQSFTLQHIDHIEIAPDQLAAMVLDHILDKPELH